LDTSIDELITKPDQIIMGNQSVVQYQYYYGTVNFIFGNSDETQLSEMMKTTENINNQHPSD
jgi:hypothetical protein